MDKIEELLKDPKTDLQKQALTDKSYKKTPNNAMNPKSWTKYFN